MECKFRKTGSYQKPATELIDTLWNVNWRAIWEDYETETN